MADLDKTSILAGGASNQHQTIDISDRTIMNPGGAGTPRFAPSPVTPLTLLAVPARPCAAASQPSQIDVLFECTAHAGASAVRPPLNVCLCLDRSGSMEGEPLDYAKRACEYVVDLMDAQDVLSVVTFSDQADVVMSARRVLDKGVLKDYIRRISVGNTTNLSDGMATAAAQLQAGRSDRSVNRVLLLTDGEPTSGSRDFATITQFVADQKRQGVAVTALGFGPDYNEELLATIARRSGGNYYYITRPELIPEVFRREMDMLARTVARNLQLSLHVVRSVTVTAVHGRDIAQPEPRGYSVVMDDIERGATVSVLASVALDRRPAGQYRIIRATLTYEDCVTGASRRAEADVVLEITDDRAKLSSPVNPKVTSQLQLVRAAHDLDRTMAAVRANDLDVTQAIQNLERTQTLLVSQGLGKDAAGITQAIDMVASGGSLEKTLMGAIIDLEKGKRT